MLKPYLIFLIVINFITLVAFGYDKAAASDGRFRIPVYSLMLPLSIGGAYGAMLPHFLYRHKIRKSYFTVPIVFCAAVNTIILAALHFV